MCFSTNSSRRVHVCVRSSGPKVRKKPSFTVSLKHSLWGSSGKVPAYRKAVSSSPSTTKKKKKNSLWLHLCLQDLLPTSWSGISKNLLPRNRGFTASPDNLKSTRILHQLFPWSSQPKMIQFWKELKCHLQVILGFATTQYPTVTWSMDFVEYKHGKLNYLLFCNHQL
jgi:hypothetical protein